jgi:transcriptional regulator with XRE-family HTH domain
MNKETTGRLAEYIKALREARKLSIRGLASKAGLDSGALTRLEQGKVRAPQPDTLAALATALQVPLADLFAMANYLTPHDLPSVTPYLRARYGHLPEDALASIDNYLRRLIDEYDFDPNGPHSLEDEARESSSQH